MDITKIAEGIITILVALVTGFLIPYIKSKTTKAEYDKILFWVKLAVQAAEQIYDEAGQGETKKEYVISYLRGIGLEVDTVTLDKMIESAVYEINAAAKNE